MRPSTYGFCHGDRGAVLTSRIPRDWTRLENTAPYTASRSRRRSRGAVSHGNASTSCWAVHRAVGASVTLTWTTRRRLCARTTKTNKTLNSTVGTVKKSTETRLPMWLSRNVRHVCDGGVRRRPRYLETVACEISRPSFWSSPWIRGAPHRGLARAMVRMSARTSGATAGRPGPCRRVFQVQTSRKPARCQRMTVLGLDDGDDL